MDTREKILTDLYSLRAGLSVLSQNKDKVYAIKHNTDNQLRAIQNNLKNKIKQQIRNDDITNEAMEMLSREDGIEELVRTNKCKQMIKAYEKKQNDYVEANNNNARAYKSDFTFLSICAAVAVVAIAALMTIFALVLTLPDKLTFMSDTAKTVMKFVSVPASVVLLIVFIVLCVKAKESLDWVGIAKKRAGNEIADKVDEKQLLAYEAQALEQYRACKRDANKLIEPKMQLHNAAYNALVETYAGVLDQRDWPYLDLLIYYFETDRAGTMREALQQLDRERQTQQIVGTIQTATMTICRTIQEEMSVLRGTIQMGFAALQTSIDRGFAQMNAIGQAQLEQLSLANALRAKANATSEQLMRDVSYMKSKLTY